MTIIPCMVSEICSATNNYLPFWTVFCPYDPENQNFEKMKKIPWDIVILHMYIINDNHMISSSWGMEQDRQNFLSFWIIFCFYPKKPRKNKLWKKEKKAWRYHHFTHVYWKLWSQDEWFLKCGARQMEVWTSGRMEKVTDRGVCPILKKKKNVLQKTKLIKYLAWLQHQF